MNIEIKITDNFLSSFKYEIEAKVKQEVDKYITDTLSKIDFTKIVNDRITYNLDKSKYISEGVIRNFVQQKIARELTDKVFKYDK
jgi:hypothetical protein